MSDCKRDWWWVRSPLEEKKYLSKFIFSFLRSGVEAKRGIEFRHSKRNASFVRIPQKVGNSVVTLDSLCLTCCVFVISYYQMWRALIYVYHKIYVIFIIFEISFISWCYCKKKPCEAIISLRCLRKVSFFLLM